MVSRKKKILSFVITALGLLALFLVAVNTGSLKVTPLELFKGLFIEYNENVATIYDLRFPRILIAIFGGNRRIRRAAAGCDEKPAGRPRHHRRQFRG